jgi:amino acid efflux transporter
MDGALTTRSATALYIGAVLGPGVLLMPSLVAQVAGPASIIAWVALLALSLPLAIAFAGLGARYPEAGGTAAYARAAFGPRTGAVTGWWFLAAVLVGAPAVALIGGNYVAVLLGTGRAGALVAAVAMIGAVLAANAAGVRATARVQLILTGTLAALLIVASATALPHTRAANWTPFAPHGWAAVGSAGSLLMFSFIGWEAVSHLVGRLPDPKRQLPCAIFAALAAVVVLYLALATATIGVLGTAAPGDVPLADLMQAGLGAPGRTATAGLAVLLTMGTMNAYVAATVQLAGALADVGAAPAAARRPRVALAVLGGIAGVLLALLALRTVSAEALVRACSTCFVAVYAPALAAGARLLAGGARRAAAGAFAVVLVLLGFSGVFLLVPAAIAIVVLAGLAHQRQVPLQLARLHDARAGSTAPACDHEARSRSVQMLHDARLHDARA